MMDGLRELWAMVVAVLAVLLGFLYWRVYGSGRLKGITPPVPPGSFGWPVLGETVEFLRCNRANKSAQFFKKRVAKYGPVFSTHVFLGPVVSLDAPAGNKFLFANENKLVQQSWPPSIAKLLGKHNISNKVGEDHRISRRLFTTFFNPEGLQTYVPRIDAITRDHIAKYWEGKQSILGVPTVKEFTFAVAAGLFVSLADNDPRFRPFENATEDFLAGLFQIPIDLPGTAYRKGRHGREAMLKIVETLIAERKQEIAQGKATSKTDLLAMLLTTPNEEGVYMSDDAIKDNINNLLFAGLDTSSITLALVLKYLHLNRECYRQVVQEQQEIAMEKQAGDVAALLDWADTRKMKYTWQVVQETLRLQPPVGSAFRIAMQDFQYAGYTIFKGWKLLYSPTCSHGNPAYFPNPKKFDPLRFEGSEPPPYVWIPFGGGPHICLGNEFARTEIMVFLHYIVLNFEWEMVDPQEPISIDPMMFQKALQLRIRLIQLLKRLHNLKHFSVKNSLKEK